MIQDTFIPLSFEKKKRSFREEKFKRIKSKEERINKKEKNGCLVENNIMNLYKKKKNIN